MAKVYDKKALISGVGTNTKLKKAIKKAPSSTTSSSGKMQKLPYKPGTASASKIPAYKPGTAKPTKLGGAVTGGIGAVASRATAKKTAAKKKLY